MRRVNLPQFPLLPELVGQRVHVGDLLADERLEMRLAAHLLHVDGVLSVPQLDGRHHWIVHGLPEEGRPGWQFNRVKKSPKNLPKKLPKSQITKDACMN